MAKSKPNRAFLEALKQEKRRRGEDGTGGGFKTPDWFFNSAAEAQDPGAVRPNEAAARRGFKPTYKHAVIAGGLLAVIVVIAYMAGRGQSRPQIAEEITAVRGRPPQAEVMDIAGAPDAPEGPPMVVPAVALAPAESVAAGGARIVGMNYVILQGYPSEQDAREVARTLQQGGVECTVERIPDWSKTWFMVVGTTPFTREDAKGATYQQYLRRAQQMSDKIPSKFKKLEPSLYRWR